MPYIYLHKLNWPEKNRVDPDDIWMIKAIETDDGIGSIVTFKDNEIMHYKETPKEIHFKEWQMRYLWPNVERAIMSVLGGVIGSLMTLLFQRHV